MNNQGENPRSKSRRKPCALITRRATLLSNLCFCEKLQSLFAADKLRVFKLRSLLAFGFLWLRRGDILTNSTLPPIRHLNYPRTYGAFPAFRPPTLLQKTFFRPSLPLGRTGGKGGPPRPEQAKIGFFEKTFSNVSSKKRGSNFPPLQRNGYFFLKVRSPL